PLLTPTRSLSLSPTYPPLPPFFNATPPTDISPLSLHDALPICSSTASPSTSATTTGSARWCGCRRRTPARRCARRTPSGTHHLRSEEHTSELQSLTNLVCRLLLEKKKQQEHHSTNPHPHHSHYY